MRGPARGAVTYALIAVAIAAAWIALQATTVHDGHLSGLFWTGAAAALPANTPVADTARVADARGYDAQYYRLIAHDPLARRYQQYVDNPSLRWRRIGVPGLAFTLAMGRDALVEPAYVATLLAFVFLGVFWLAQFAGRYGRHAAWGLAFLAVPAVLVSLERMTVDLPLAALTIGFALYASERPSWRLWAVLAAAPLVRETGMLLVIAWCVYALLKRERVAAGIGAACAAPAAAWWLYVAAVTPADATPWLSTYPFSGLIRCTAAAFTIPAGKLGLLMAALLEDTALVGIWLALALALYAAWKRRWGHVEIAAVAITVFAATLGKLDIWDSAYAAGRTMSPLLVLLGLIALRDRRPVYALPLALILPRIALQYMAVVKIMLAGGKL